MIIQPMPTEEASEIDQASEAPAAATGAQEGAPTTGVKRERDDGVDIAGLAEIAAEGAKAAREGTE